MNEMEQPPASHVNGNPVKGTKSVRGAAAENTAIPITQDDGPTVIQGNLLVVTDEDVGAPATANLSQSQILEAADLIADAVTDPDTAVTVSENPEFDNLQSLTRFLLGVALEGSKDLSMRLQLWEEFLREELPEAPDNLAEASERDLLRYALIGFVFEAEDTSRTLLSKLLKVPSRAAHTAVRATKPVTNSRLARPFQRRIDRLAERGQEQILNWIQRGHTEEPLSRNLARLGVQEIVDEIINQLAQNEEVQTLVQEQGVGLAGEVVDQVRERTFTADALVERIARAITRRNPREAPPMADLSDYPKKLPPG